VSRVRRLFEKRFLQMVQMLVDAEDDILAWAIGTSGPSRSRYHHQGTLV
jgi:hypothetical protein